MALARYIEATGNCDVFLSQAVAQCLDPRKIPKASAPPDHHSIVGATGALCVISAQCRTILLNKASTRPMVEFLTSHYLGFVKWCRFIKGKGRFTLTGAAFLFMMMNMDDSLKDTIMGSRSAVNLAISLWTSKDRRGRYFVADEENDARCPMLFLLLTVVEDKTGRSTFLNLLHTGPAKAKRMARAIRVRILDLVTRHSEEGISTTSLLQHVHDLVQLARVLLYRAMGTHPFFLEPLQNPKLLFNIFRSLDSLLCEGRDTLLSWDGVTDVFYFAFEILPDVGHGSTSPVAKIKSALDGGLLRVALMLLLCLPPGSSGFSFILDSITSIAACSTYRDVAVALSKSLSTLDPDLVIRAEQKAPRLRSCRGVIEKSTRFWGAEPGDDVQVEQLCHCVEHLSVQSQHGAQDGRSRKCSGCHTVAYCSTLCQRVDWLARHREECMTTRMKGSDDDDVIYYSSRIPFKIQRELAYFVQSTTVRHFSAFKAIHACENLGSPLHSLVLVIDYLTMPLTAQIVTVDAFRDNHPQMQRRVHDCLTQHLKDEETYLVDAVFLWGRLGVNLLVTLRKSHHEQEEDRFSAVGAVVIGFLDPATHDPAFPVITLENTRVE